MESRTLMLVAGEASGDLHAARLLGEVRQQLPDVELQAFGFGADELRANGLEIIEDGSRIAVVGIVEVLKVLPLARHVFRRLLEEAEARRPDVAVLVDFPEFNLRLARELKRRGIPVVYYISPQVWAWRRRRVREIARVVDEMLVLFPFEADFYRGHDVAVTHVGHPLVDEVPELPQAWAQGRPADDVYRLALLPGSRPSEVSRLLVPMLQAAALLSRDVPLRVRLIKARSVEQSQVDALLQSAALPAQLPVEVIDADRFQAVADSHLALCASGTATLETGLLGTPLIVVYRLSRWTYLLGRLLVRLPFISLVNLVLDRQVVPELLQGQAEPANIAREARRLLTTDGEVERMRVGLAGLRQALGERGASRRAAAAVVPWLQRQHSVPAPGVSA